MNDNFETTALAIHRIEVIEFRGGIERAPLIYPFDDSRMLRSHFAGIANRSFKQMINNWTFSATNVWTRVELYRNDTLIDQVIITAGIEQSFTKKTIA